MHVHTITSELASLTSVTPQNSQRFETDAVCLSQVQSCFVCVPAGSLQEAQLDRLRPLLQSVTMTGASKRKAMEQDVDTDDLEERAMMQQPRSRFSELEPSADQGISQRLACLVLDPSQVATISRHLRIRS